MWNLPRPGIEPVSSGVAGGVFTTRPPGVPRAVPYSSLYPQHLAPCWVSEVTLICFSFYGAKTQGELVTHDLDMPRFLKRLFSAPTSTPSRSQPLSLLRILVLHQYDPSLLSFAGGYKRQATFAGPWNVCMRPSPAAGGSHSDGLSSKQPRLVLPLKAKFWGHEARGTWASSYRGMRLGVGFMGNKLESRLSTLNCALLTVL